jgi:hypothetical protein
MADFENPFSGIGAAVADFWGPSDAMKRQRELLGHQAGQEAATRQRDDQARAELEDLYAKSLEASGGDRNLALKKFVTDPGFISSPLAKDTSSMMKIIQDIHNPKPQLVGEGAALVNDQNKQVYKNERPAEPAEDPGNKAFQTELGKKLASNVEKLQEDGRAAQHDDLVLSEINGLLNKPGFNTGAAAVIKSHLARMGIKTQGSSDVEVFDSLVSRLIPTLGRQGLPGAASDKDVAMFRASLPELMKSLPGNAVIVDTLRAMNESRIKSGDIANQIASGDITMKQAAKMLRDIPNPMAAFNDFQAKRQGTRTGNTPAPRIRTYNPTTGELE